MGRFFLDPKTKEIYTPNTDKTTSFGGGNAPKKLQKPLDNSADGGIIEERYNDGSRYTKDEHGHFTGSSAGGGGGSLGGSSSSGKSDNKKIIETEIKNGNIKLDINHEKQARHIKGDKGYISGRSYITISETEAQKVINQQYGTGIIQYNSEGKPAKEKINCGKIIGIDVDINTKAETKTDKGTIHYSKTGTHLVPRKENNNGKP